MIMDKKIKQTIPSLEPVKKLLRQKAENRLRVGSFYYCDGCNKAIHHPEDGFIIHGNIYVADPTCRGGLIGNHFPEVEPGTKIEVTDVKEQCLCKACFFSALQMNASLQEIANDVPLYTEDESKFIEDDEFLKELERLDGMDNLFVKKKWPGVHQEKRETNLGWCTIREEGN